MSRQNTEHMIILCSKRSKLFPLEPLFVEGSSTALPPVSNLQWGTADAEIKFPFLLSIQS